MLNALGIKFREFIINTKIGSAFYLSFNFFKLLIAKK